VDAYNFTNIVSLLDFAQIFTRGLYAPLCITSKELPSAEGLRPRMTTIAYENGLLGGVNDDVLEAMSLALEVSASHEMLIPQSCISY
jgi:Transcriptional regulator of RNA polII, SAGA, subunit